MPKQITKSITGHAVADKIAEERRCHKSLNASLKQVLKQTGGDQSEYLYIPDDLDVESSAPSNSGYSSRHLMDCQAELKYSSPQAASTPVSYYGGNKEEDDVEDEEASHVGVYRTRLNVQQRLPQGRAPSQSTLIMTGDEAVEAITKEAHLATAAKIEAHNAAEESKRRKEWESMWQANSGTWISTNFMEGLGDHAPLDSKLQPKPFLGPPPLGRMRAPSRRASVCSGLSERDMYVQVESTGDSHAPSDSKLQPKLVLGPPPSGRSASRCASVCSSICDVQRDGDSLTSGASDTRLLTWNRIKSVQDLTTHVQIERLGDSHEPSQDLAPHLKSQSSAEAQAQARFNLLRHQAPTQTMSRDFLYSYGGDSLPGGVAPSHILSCPQPVGLSLDNLCKPGLSGNLLDQTKELSLDAAVPRGHRRHSTLTPSQLHFPLPTNADFPLRLKNSLEATLVTKRRISGTVSKGLLSHSSSPALNPAEHMRGDKANRRKSVVFCDADSGDNQASGSNSSLPAVSSPSSPMGSQWKQNITKAAASAKLVSAFNRPSTIMEPTDPTVQTYQIEGSDRRRSVSFSVDLLYETLHHVSSNPELRSCDQDVPIFGRMSEPQGLICPANSVPNALSPDSPTPDGADADSASPHVFLDYSPKPTLVSRFAGKLRLLTGRLMVNDRSCSVAPEPNSPLSSQTHSPSPPLTSTKNVLLLLLASATGSEAIREIDASMLVPVVSQAGCMDLPVLDCFSVLLLLASAIGSGAINEMYTSQLVPGGSQLG
eukprot:gene29118-32334_t